MARTTKRTQPHFRTRKRRRAPRIIRATRRRIREVQTRSEPQPDCLARRQKGGAAKAHRSLQMTQIRGIVTRIWRQANARCRRFTLTEPAAHRQVRGRNLMSAGAPCDPGSPLTQQLASRIRALASRPAHGPDHPFSVCGATAAASPSSPAVARRPPPSRSFSCPTIVRPPLR